MRDGFRYALLLAACLTAVLFITAFTAWGLTTYGSVRHVVGDLSAQPDKAADLRSQYEDMVTVFAGGASSFTYYYGSAPITVAAAQVAGMGESQVISLVMDAYASGLYDNTLQSGGLGAASQFIGSGGNLIYAIIALVLALAFALFVAGAVLGFADRPRPYALMSAGKTIGAFSIALFFIFAMLPGFVKSLVWGSIAGNAAAREILTVVEPGLVGTLLRNTLLVILVAVALYGAGYWMEARGDVREMFRTSRATARKAERPANHTQNSGSGNNKRRSL